MLVNIVAVSYMNGDLEDQQWLGETTAKKFNARTCAELMAKLDRTDEMISDDKREVLFERQFGDCLFFTLRCTSESEGYEVVYNCVARRNSPQ